MKMSRIFLWLILLPFSSCVLEEVNEKERAELNVLISKDFMQDTNFIREFGSACKLKLNFFQLEMSNPKQLNADIIISSDIYNSTLTYGNSFIYLPNKLFKNHDSRFTTKQKNWLGMAFIPHIIISNKSISKDSLKNMDSLSLWQTSLQLPSKNHFLANEFIFQLALKNGETYTSSLVSQLAKGDSSRFYDTLKNAKNNLLTGRFSSLLTTQREFLNMCEKNDTISKQFNIHYLNQGEGGTSYSLYGIAALTTGRYPKNQLKFMETMANVNQSARYALHYFGYHCLNSKTKQVNYIMNFLPEIYTIHPIRWNQQYLKSKRFVKKSSWKSSI